MIYPHLIQPPSHFPSPPPGDPNLLCVEPPRLVKTSPRPFKKETRAEKKANSSVTAGAYSRGMDTCTQEIRAGKAAHGAWACVRVASAAAAARCACHSSFYRTGIVFVCCTQPVHTHTHTHKMHSLHTSYAHRQTPFSKR